jgi:hypothetical protein
MTRGGSEYDDNDDQNNNESLEFPVAQQRQQQQPHLYANFNRFSQQDLYRFFLLHSPSCSFQD